MADIIRQPAKYIAELFRPFDFDPRVALADSEYSRVNNIFQFSIAEQITDPSNYWITWGGTFDNFDDGYGIQIFFEGFLIEVFSSAAMVLTENSFWINKVDDSVYIHLPRNPWQYSRYKVKFFTNNDSVYASGPKDENNLSDNIYDGIKVETRLSVPSIQNKLSNLVSGIRFYNEFQISIDNTDGKYDGNSSFEILDFFNTPIQISKTVDNAQSIEDFNRIQKGVISNIDIEFDGDMTVHAGDTLYNLNRSVCQKFSIDDYPNAPDSTIGKDIPVAWGPVTGVELFKIDQDTSDPSTWIDYIAIDKAYINEVFFVYDSDGNSLTHTFNSTTGVIRVTEVDDSGEVIDGESADIFGIPFYAGDNNIGIIIINILRDVENIQFIEGIWDVDETRDYINICADIGYYFKGGPTRKLVEEVLKNDNAFLIQKVDGRLTLRQWGQEYDTHEIDSWPITQKPSKDFEEAWKYYCSTVKILSAKNQKEDTYQKTYVNDFSELEIAYDYNRSFTAEFETDLIDDDEIEDFAQRLLNHFGTVRETLGIGVGVDTFEINLLDTVSLSVIINGRQFSKFSTWIVKGINPGQDEIIIEDKDSEFILTFQGDNATLDGDLFEVVT